MKSTKPKRLRKPAKRKPTVADPDDIDRKANLLSLPDSPVVVMNPPYDTTEKSASILEQLKSGDAFFYPASGFDWYPIIRFSDRCSLFIYCDWATSLQDFEAAVNNIHTSTPAGDALRCHAIQLIPSELGCSSTCAPTNFLTQTEMEAYQPNDHDADPPQGWGRKVDLSITVDGQVRHVILVFLYAEGVATYLTLFKEQKQTPRFLCIKRCGDGFGGNWTNFNNWTGPLGRAVLANWRENRKAHEFLITDRQHDWPWNFPLEQYMDWDGQPTLYCKPSHPLAKAKRRQQAAKRSKAATNHPSSEVIAPVPIGQAIATDGESARLRSVLEGRNVFYYPECCRSGKFDWQPLYRLTHQCDTLLFNDWNGDVKRFVEEVQRLGDATPVCNNLRFVRFMDIEGVQKTQHKLAVLRRTVGATTREVQILFLGGDYAQVYGKLFSGRDAAPKFLCVKSLKTWNNEVGCQNGSLRRAVEDEVELLGRKPPAFLIGNLGDDGGRWRHLWQDYAVWGARAFALARQVGTRELPSRVKREDRRVVAKRRTLSGESSRNVQAAMLTAHMAQQGSWPFQRFLLVDDTDGAQLPVTTASRQIIPFRFRGLSMGTVLENLERVCSKHQIRRVACVPFGFEDEGPVLDAWRQTGRGGRLNLDIYCQTDGDLVSFDGCVDQFEP